MIDLYLQDRYENVISSVKDTKKKHIEEELKNGKNSKPEEIIQRKENKNLTERNNKTLFNNIIKFQVNNENANSSRKDQLNVTTVQNQHKIQANYQTSFAKLEKQLVNDNNLKLCQFCGRKFLADRYLKHSKICQKFKKKQRKVFDSVKMRTKGTEMEKYLTKPWKNSKNDKVVSKLAKQVIVILKFLAYF